LRKVNFQLAWIPSGQYTYAFVAQELGFWSDLGLDVQVHRGFGSGSTSNNVATGQYEVGEASFGTAVLTASKGGLLVAMGARYQKSPIGFVALKKKGLRKPKDLEGMTVADSAGSGAYVLLPAFARATGIDLAKVKIQFVDPAAYLPSLLAERVDAVSTYIVSIGPPLLARDIQFDFLFHAD
jgi:NitT/TauT family transport system substrate-binding protein